MTYQTSVPVVENSYPSSGYGDDLAMASLWLGLAQNDSSLIGQAKGYYDQFQLGSQLQGSVFNWDSVLPGIPILATQIYQSYPHLGGNSWQTDVEAYLDGVVSGKGAGKLSKGFAVSGSRDKVLTGRRRWITLLQPSVTTGELESGPQRCHAVEEILCDCERRQEEYIPGDSPPSLLKLVTLIQRFSNSQQVKSTTSLARTRCLVRPFPVLSHQ